MDALEAADLEHGSTSEAYPVVQLGDAPIGDWLGHDALVGGVGRPEPPSLRIEHEGRPWQHVVQRLEFLVR